VVVLPGGERGLERICTALLSAEVNMHYAYPLIWHPLGKAALAIKVDDTEMAGDVLARENLRMLSESDLSRDDDPEGGGLREVLYRRIRAHFQFQNQFMTLFISQPTE